MDKTKAENLLANLAPDVSALDKEFDAIWPATQEAMQRGVQLKVIWSELKKAGLSFSYVTFTRYVRKK
ncbi:MAG TPA: hypothetical protein VEC35_09595, partial [Noviherbaspirillum sp.]|nr:hypothetical protein [Noviherbaspirillum sp.]